MRILIVAALMLGANQASAQILETCGVQRPFELELAWQDASLSLQVCDATSVKETWEHFHMGEGEWDRYGLQEDACNSNTPLGRTFNALLTMRRAAANPTCESTAFPLDWAYCYSSEFIVKLVARCWDAKGSANARTFTWALDQMNERTELYKPFYYDMGPVRRAATIFHESRHAHDDCNHTTNCSAGIDGDGNHTVAACDPQWEHGCVNGEGKGAYAWGAIWLHRYAVEAVDRVINQDLREYAVEVANVIVGWHFDVPTCFQYEVKTGHVQQIEGCTP